MISNQSRQRWEDQRVRIAKQLFPHHDLADPEVQAAMDYLEDCVDAGRMISDKFYHIF